MIIQEKSLGELAGGKYNFVDGPFGSNLKSSEYTESGVPLIQLKNIKPNYYLPKDLKFVSQEKADSISRHTYQAGDIVIAKLGAVGTACIIPDSSPNGIVVADVCRFRGDRSQINYKYLCYFLNSSEGQRRVLEYSRGSTRLRTNLTDLKKVKVPLPPLEIQKQIAAVLEKADQLRKDCQQMEQELNSLSQSVFLDMFGDPVSNPKGWEVKPLKFVANVQLGKMLSSKSKQGLNPKKYLRNANVQWRNITTADLLTMDFTDNEIKKFELKTGDLLVCEGGDIGRCAIWLNQVEDCYYQKALHRVRLDHDLLTPEYLQEYFFWMSQRGGLARSTNEVTFKHLTAEKMNKLPVPLPPIELQKKYSGIYSSILSKLEINNQSLVNLDNNFTALMQKAFKGELNLDKAAA